MDVATHAAQASVARLDNLKGIERIEVFGWSGEIQLVPCDSLDVPGLVLVAPMRSAQDLWSIAEYKQRTLLIAPHISAEGYTDFHGRIVPSGPMWLYVPLAHGSIQVMNLNNDLL